MYFQHEQVPQTEVLLTGRIGVDRTTHWHEITCRIAFNQPGYQDPKSDNDICTETFPPPP
jgi:hypothetical protein